MQKVIKIITEEKKYSDQDLIEIIFDYAEYLDHTKFAIPAEIYLSEDIFDYIPREL